MTDATQTADDSTEPEITRTDEFTLEEAVDGITRVDSAHEHTRTDVWAVIDVDTEEFGKALIKATKQSGVVVHKADRKDGAISIALEKFADEL